MTPKHRLRWAAAAAPLAGVIALDVAMAAVTWIASSDVSLGQALAGGLHALFFLTLVGAPVAYLVAAIIGVPAYEFLRARRALTLGWLGGIPAVAGAVVFPIVWTGIWGSNDNIWFTGGLGAWTGAAAGAVFWLMGVRGADRDQPSNDRCS